MVHLAYAALVWEHLDSPWEYRGDGLRGSRDLLMIHGHPCLPGCGYPCSHCTSTLLLSGWLCYWAPRAPSCLSPCSPVYPDSIACLPSCRSALNLPDLSWPYLTLLLAACSSGAAGNFLCPASALSFNAFKTVIDIDTIGTFNTSKVLFEKYFRVSGTRARTLAGKAPGRQEVSVKQATLCS